eukprot:15464023-Alexandrium_andersonii.AAC.1
MLPSRGASPDIAEECSNRVRDTLYNWFCSATDDDLLALDAQCYVHKKRCPVYKRFPERQGRKLISFAGHTCKDFS